LFHVKHLGEILSKISIIEESTILESNTRFGAPAVEKQSFYLDKINLIIRK
jgi:hypothetical protein